MLWYQVLLCFVGAFLLAFMIYDRAFAIYRRRGRERRRLQARIRGACADLESLAAEMRASRRSTNIGPELSERIGAAKRGSLAVIGVGGRFLSEKPGNAADVRDAIGLAAHALTVCELADLMARREEAAVERLRKLVRLRFERVSALSEGQGDQTGNRAGLGTDLFKIGRALDAADAVRNDAVMAVGLYCSALERLNEIGDAVALPAAIRKRVEDRHEELMRRLAAVRSAAPIPAGEAGSVESVVNRGRAALVLVRELSAERLWLAVSELDEAEKLVADLESRSLAWSGE
jgi:hypothetical protein